MNGSGPSNYGADTMSDAKVVVCCPECGNPPTPRDKSALVVAVREVLEMDLNDVASRGEAMEMLACALAVIDD